MALSSEEKEELAEIFNQTLQQRARIDPQIHRSHHEFIAAYLEEKARQDKFRSDVKKQVMGWGIIASLAAFAAWFGENAFKLLK